MKYNNYFIVDAKKLVNNINNIRHSIGDNVKLCAIVKADAYSLGIDVVCSILQGKVDFFAVACLSEALKIRMFDKTTKILILGIVDIDDLEMCIKNNISISVSSLDYLEKIVKKSNINIHLQVNTGLNRYGFRSITTFKKAISVIELSSCKLEGIYSHFATKDQDLQFIKKQFYKFLQFKRLCKEKDVICHIANSFSTSINTRYHLNMVRTGMLMYGGVKNRFNNECVLSIKSKIVAIQNVRKGESIGYDRTFKAIKKMTIAIVGLGYADGLDRRLSNKFYVLINGFKCRIVGMICMDVFMVDISDINVDVGADVVILGKDGKNKITIDDMSRTIGVSSYELMCRFNTKRMTKIIIRS